MTSILVKALEDLLEVKNHKDIAGKDAWYNSNQPKAWQQAREALSLYSQSKEGEDKRSYNESHAAYKIVQDICWRKYGQTFDILCKNEGNQQSGFWLDIILPAMEHYASDCVMTYHSETIESKENNL